MNKMNRLINKFLKGRITKNIFLIAGGTAFVQIVNVIISPILTRIYSPEEFGILTIYTSLIGLIAGTQSFRYELAIPISDDGDSIDVVLLCFLILIFNTLVLTVILLLAGNSVLTLLSADELLKYKLLIPVGILLFGLYQIFMMWNYRKKNFKNISKTLISQSISGSVTKIVFGILGCGPIGLIVGKTIGESAGIKTLSRCFFKTKKSFYKMFSWQKIIEIAKRYKKFPLYTLPSTFLSMITTQMPTLFIAYYFGESVVGAYGFSISIASLPMSLIGKAVGDVFYGEAATIGRSNPRQLKELSGKIILRLTVIGIVPLSLLVLFGPFLFQLVFGEEWRIAGEYARVLAFLSFFQLVFQPVSRIYEVYERQRENFLITLFRIGLLSLIFVISIIFKLDIMVVISLYTISMIIINAITYYYANKIIKIEIEREL